MAVVVVAAPEILPVLIDAAAEEGAGAAADAAADAASDAGADASVTQEGIDAVSAHLQPPLWADYNDAMIARLQATLDEGGSAESADLNFYNHELAEAQFMDDGMEYQEAHDAALDLYGHSPYEIYHPDVIQQFPSEFNSNFLQYWGLQ